MAQALLARRLWTLSTKAVRCLPALTASHRWPSFSTSVLCPISYLPPPRTLFRHTCFRIMFFLVHNKEYFRTRVMNSDVPVLVEFRAQWCGRSGILGARLEKAAVKRMGGVALATVDIDDLTDLAVKYEVDVLPTVIAVRGGSIVDRFEGMKDEDQLDSFISELLGK